MEKTVNRLPCYPSLNHLGAPGSRKFSIKSWPCSQRRMRVKSPQPREPRGSWVSPAPEGGQEYCEVSGFSLAGSCLSEGFSVPWNCTECLLWLFLLPPFFLLTLPIRLYESQDSTGKQQMLTFTSFKPTSAFSCGVGNRQEGENLWGSGWTITFCSEL